LIINSLSRISANFLLVPLRTKRSVDLDELIMDLDWLGIPVRKYGSLKRAYSSLLKSASLDDIIIVVGSHYLVGEFLKYCV